MASGGDQRGAVDSDELAGKDASPGSAGGSALAALKPGNRLAGRYLVVRRLGRGGMGEVYEVEDLALHEHVALKIVRPEIAGEPGAVVRFRREIHLARKVTHPNVCRIFDIGFDHQLVDGREVQIVFLTISEMMSTELAAGEKLRTLPGEAVARMKIELSLAEADRLAGDTLARVARNLGSDLVVLGSYTSSGERGGKLRLEVRVQDTASGETLCSASDGGSEEELPDLVSRLGRQLRTKLGAGEILPSEVASARAAMPSHPEAARGYAQGLDRLRRFDLTAAHALLEKSIAAQPDFPLSHAALSDTWAQIGNERKAREEAGLAFARSSGLRREERLLVEARKWRTAGEPDRAIGVYHALREFFPDDLEHGLRLVEAEALAGKGKEAMATLAGLRKLPPPDGDDARIDLLHLLVMQSIGDERVASQVAADAVRRSEARGQRIIGVRAHVHEAMALYNLGDLERAISLAERARQLARGDLKYEGLAALTVAAARRLHGDYAHALESTVESIRLMEQAGQLVHLNEPLTFLAQCHFDQGELRSAQQDLTRAEAAAREIADPWARPTIRVIASSIQRQQGALTAAGLSIEEAVATFRRLGDRRMAAWAERLHGELLRDQDRLIEARRQIEGALKAQEELGLQLFAAESRLALAMVAIDEGRAVEGEALARAALARFERHQAHDHVAQALVALARSLRAQGREADADRTIERAAARAASSESADVRTAVAIERSRAASDGDAGERLLDGALAEANRLGFVGRAFEVRLALGELEMKRRSANVARSRLAALGKEARTQGFLLIVRRAKSLLAR